MKRMLILFLLFLSAIIVTGCDRASFSTTTSGPDGLLVGIFIIPQIESAPEFLSDFENDDALKLMFDDQEDPDGTTSGKGITSIVWEKTELDDTVTFWLTGSIYLDFDIIPEVQVYGVYIDSLGEHFLEQKTTIVFADVQANPEAVISTTEETGDVTREFNVSISFFDFEPVERVEIFNFTEENLMFGSTILIGHGDWNVDVFSNSAYIIILETFESEETRRTLYERGGLETATFDVLMMTEYGYAVPEIAHLDWGE